MGSAVPPAATAATTTSATGATTSATTPARVAAGWCSARSAAVGEPTAGTAPRAVAWLVVEQPGPWGRDAVTDSRLDPAIGRELARRAAEAGVRVSLARRPGAHPDRAGAARGLWLAYTVPGRTWLWRGRFVDPGHLLDLDLAGVAAGLPPDPAPAVPGGSRPGAALAGGLVTEPMLLVCTNARRDRCCAVAGRPVARALAASHPGQVWEASHLGGHRFAATAVVLPAGYAYGRLDAAGGRAVLAAGAGGTLHPDGLRGRSTWSPAAQAAEIEVRRRIGEWSVDALLITDEHAAADVPGGTAVLVTHRDGRRWRAVVARDVDGARLRPESCGKPAVPVASHRVHRLDPA